MTTELAELALALCDLAEHEGRTLRKSVVRTAAAAGLAGTAAVALAIATGLAAWGLFSALAVTLGTAGAALTTAAVAAATAGILTWLALRFAR